MMTIEIQEVVEDTSAMVDVLNTIATMVKEGYTSGVDPYWKINEEE